MLSRTTSSEKSGLTASDYFFAAGAVMMFIALVAMRLSSPVLFAYIVARPATGDIDQVLLLALYAATFFLSRLFDEARSMFYLLFEVRAQKLLSLNILRTLFGSRLAPQPVGSHSNQEIVIERGLSGLRSAAFVLLFSIVPVFVEAAVIAVIISFTVGSAFALLTGAIIIAFFVATGLISMETHRRQKTSFALNANVYSILSAAIRSRDTLLLFNAFGWITNHISRSFDRYAAAVRHSMWPGVLLSLLQGFFLLSLVASILFLMYQAPSGDTRLALERLVLVNGLLLHIVNPLAIFSSSFKHFVQATTESLSLLSLLRAQPAKNLAFSVDSSHPSICLRNFHVSFPGRTVIRPISLEIPVSGITCIVGKSGSGKSTLARSIVGMCHYTGEIISPIGREEIILIDQEVDVFDTTLEQNVALDESWDHSALLCCLRNAGFDETELQDLLGRALGENGAAISGGQRKRIGIARMLFHRHKLTILDEPTSEVDSVTTTAIMRTIAEVARTRPLIVVTHDEKVLRLADRVLTVESGKLQLSDLSHRTNGSLSAMATDATIHRNHSPDREANLGQ